MAKTYNRMRIDVNESINSIGINPVQNDTQSRYLDVFLYNNGLPIDLTGEVVRINFKKEDGTTFFNQGEVTDAAEGRCQFALTNEVLSDAKAVKAQISIWSGEGQILSTQVFTIYVSESIRNDEAVESTNEFGVLVVLFQEIQNSLDLMKRITENFGEPGEKAAEFGAETFWQMLETLASRADVQGAIRALIKELVNSTIDTDFFMPLDKLLGAKIQIRGYSGMRFTVTNDNLKKSFIVELTDNDELEDAETKVRFKIVPVPVGEYTIKVDSFLDSGDFTLDVKVVLGETARIYYNKLIPVATITESGQYTFQTEPVFISAIAGGGGGGGGGGCINKSNDYSKRGGGGGGGGGAGQRVENKPFWGLNGITKNITIGLGGEGGLKITTLASKGENGKNGEATIIEGLFTLVGGEGGEGGNPTTDKAAGGNIGGGYGAGAEGSSGSGGAGGGGGGGGIEGKGGDGGIGAGTHNSESGGQGFTGGNGEGENGGIGGVGGNVDSLGAASVAGENATGYGGGGGGGGGAGGSTASNRNYNPGSDGGNGSKGAVFIYKGVAV